MNIIKVTLPNSTISFTREVQLFLFYYQFIMITTAIVGNSIVVYATKMFNAIHLDSASVLLIQNLAVTDIALIMIAYVPKLVTLYTGRWVLGPVICYLTAFCQFVPGAVEIITLTCISAYRWYMVRFPFRRTPKAFATKVLILLMWLAAMTFPVIFVTANKSRAIFDVRTLACSTNIGFHHRYLALAALFFFGILPVALTIILNLYTLACAFWITHSTSPAKTYNKQALITVNAICWIFVLSWVPYIIRAIMATLSIPLPLWFYTMQYNLNIISLTFNPIVYTITNRRFRRFILRRISRIVSSQLPLSLRSAGKMNVITTPKDINETGI
ncbi:galanin receptor 2a-like [Bolinopsis microptera]|uniref:galanin receptor 2a-like n=1 Tax=Bolinopsis microptera TaxID=2820187 RepID=UPI0030790224